MDNDVKTPLSVEEPLPGDSVTDKLGNKQTIGRVVKTELSPGGKPIWYVETPDGIFIARRIHSVDGELRILSTKQDDGK